MDARIIIWNTRGGCLSQEEKKQLLIELVQASKGDGVCPIFLIQEAGIVMDYGKNLREFDTYLGEEYHVYQQGPLFAGNKRCALQTLIPKYMKNKDVSAYPLDSGFGDRPLLVVNFSDFCLANIHAPSGVPKYAISCIGRGISNLEMKKLPWLIGGDMNVESQRLIDYFDSNACYYNVFAPLEPTHHENHDPYQGKVLDYFIGHSSVYPENIFVKAVSDDYSDHNIVILDL